MCIRDSGNTITINGTGIDVNGTGTLNIDGSTIQYAGGGTPIRGEADSVLSAGSGAKIIGSGTPSSSILNNLNPDWELVGDISNVQVGESGSNKHGQLTVIGSVTNCTTYDGDSRLIQWHHTLDTQQLLDADSAGDDDMKLPKPSLDNAHELQLGG